MATRRIHPDVSDQQMAFICAYMTHGNGTKACIEAGYSPKGAPQTASKLLRNPKVARVHQELAKRIQARTDIKAEDLLRNLKLLMNANVMDYYDFKTGKPIMDLRKMTREQAYPIKKMRVSHNGYTTTCDIEFDDRLRAMDLVSKILGFQHEEEQKAIDTRPIINVISHIDAPPASNLDYTPDDDES